MAENEDESTRTPWAGDDGEYVPVIADISGLPRYQWQPLQDRNYRRLVHLHPAPNFEDSIVVSLSQHPPEEIPEYLALSYHWGDPELRHNIIMLPDMPCVEGLTMEEACRRSISEIQRKEGNVFSRLKRTMIHDNLLLALRHLRSTDSVVCVWTDLLCINQSDNEEKNEQVQRMAPVYASASAIIVYLGEEEVDHEVLKLNCLFERFEEELADEIDGRTELMVDFEQFSIRLHRQWDEDIEPFGLKSNPRETYRILKRFFRKPWFQRAWVVQEARPVLEGLQTFVFVLGELIVPWRMMFFAWLFVKKMEPFNEPGEVDFNSPVLQAVMTQDDKLIDLLKRSQQLRASDARDHCFAMLGISEYAHRDELRPNYSEQPADTFLRYTRFLVNEGCGPEILSLSVKDHNTSISLPSWVPDWSSNARLSLTTRQDIPYRASGELAGSFSIVRDRVLKVSGFIFDKVLTKKAINFDTLQKQLSITGTATDYLRKRTTLLQHIYRVLREICDAAGCSELTSEAMYRFLLNDVDQVSQRIHTMPTWVPNAFQALKDGQSERSTQIADEIGFEWDKHLLMISAHLTNHQMGTTRKGYLVKVPLTIKDGDVIGVVLGCRCPLVLRKAPDHGITEEVNSSSGEFYQIVGHAYVQGIMDGEALTDVCDNFKDLYLV